MSEIFGSTTSTSIKPGSVGGNTSDVITADKKYNPDSENAQSGIAVAEAIKPIYDDIWTVDRSTQTLLYDDLEWVNGYIKTDGSIVNHAAYKVTKMLEVHQGDVISYDGLRSLSAEYGSYFLLAAYDENESFKGNNSITGGDGTAQSGTYTVPEGVSFVRLSTYNYNNNNEFKNVTMPFTTKKFCTDDLAEDVSKINKEQVTQNNRLEKVEENFKTFDFVRSFDDFEITEGYLPSIKGGTITYADGQCTDFIPVENIKSIYVKLKMTNFGDGNYCSPVACYDENKTFISNVSVIANSGYYGDVVDVEGTVVINEDIAFVRLARRKSLASTSIFEINTIRSFVDDYTVTKSRVDVIEEKQESIWKDKKWYAFGTSITDDTYLDVNGDPTGKYPQLLNEYMKANLVNCGKGGGSITSFNGLIMQKINNTDFSDADLVTLEGFPNDYSMPIGTYKDTTDETLAGAIYLAIKKIYEKAPKATVVLITAAQGQLNAEGTAGYPVDFERQDGTRQIDYNDMIIRMGRYMGCHVIDAGGKSQINNFHPEYLVDHIHHSWKGGKQYAETIWDELKNIHCNTDVSI